MRATNPVSPFGHHFSLNEVGEIAADCRDRAMRVAEVERGTPLAAGLV